MEGYTHVFPYSSPAKKGGAVMIRERLRQLANDCEERARGTRDSHARNLYHRAATDARHAHATRHLSDGELQVYWQAMNAQAMLAQWYDGSEFDASPDKLSAGFMPTISVSYASAIPLANIDLTEPVIVTQNAAVLSCPPDAMNPRQLGELCGIPERTARRAIERGWRNRWHGFFREGGARAYWFAELDAFTRSRG